MGRRTRLLSETRIPDTPRQPAFEMNVRKLSDSVCYVGAKSRKDVPIKCMHSTARDREEAFCRKDPRDGHGKILKPTAHTPDLFINLNPTT